ncbi:hypothetical protein BCV69DRAFT_208443 [Microstroma glucosiphilum]|uniref:Uncharacterized protein n=1 Tax=Pseudomicrostroma glucosiphilum TaxID=1684307 RepID=A0A316U567_9BASI|nr:hypothetical protein BCV69DRAFT_208443 [Pseudomicrostroma glucosiphilum]PWN20392.1 hypothetical protein BCV69DRAFT_208443 [Pseudomicrostroma glucosiphilum]
MLELHYQHNLSSNSHYELADLCHNPVLKVCLRFELGLLLQELTAKSCRHGLPSCYSDTLIPLKYPRCCYRGSVAIGCVPILCGRDDVSWLSADETARNQSNGTSSSASSRSDVEDRFYDCSVHTRPWACRRRAELRKVYILGLLRARSTEYSSVNKSHLPLDLCLGMARTGSLLPCLRALSKWQRCSRAIIGAEPAWKAREGVYSDYTRPGLPRLLSCQMPSVCTVRQGFNPRSLSCLLPPESKD